MWFHMFSACFLVFPYVFLRFLILFLVFLYVFPISPISPLFVWEILEAAKNNMKYMETFETNRDQGIAKT